MIVWSFMCKPILLSLLILSYAHASAQQLGVSTGLAMDLNNNARFKQVPLSVQWVPNSERRFAFLVKLDAALPLPSSRQVEAYTLQSGFAQSSSVQEKISNPWVALSIGFRFRKNLQKGGRYFFADLLPVGLANQWFNIAYKDYDNVNYEILNPDTELNKRGLFTGYGLGFVMKNFLAQAHVYSPLLASKGDYKLSYKFNAPLSITIGYLFPLASTK
ncbi:MAG: hypothetical protein EOO05_16270 [Chitinophagaceae bacterium]|nr:MAG: hypothetical protein EOO05_16270 [Chitinophagaceae bacterium]